MNISFSLSKKKIIGLLAIFMMVNIGVNIAFALPLQNMDFKLFSIKYDPSRSTEKYSYLQVKVLAKNNYWLPAKIDKVYFEVYDDKTGGLVGEGTFGPVAIDAGQVGVIAVNLKIYKGEATKNFIKVYLTKQTFEGHLKVYYPFSFMGLVPISRIPMTISLKDLLISSTQTISISSFVPAFTVKNISLVYEGDNYADAVVTVSGPIPPEITQIGTATIKKLDLNIITPDGTVMRLLARNIILDPNNVEFNATATLRFLKGDALKNFLEKAVNGEPLKGKISGLVSFDIIGLEMDDIDVEMDLSSYSGLVGGDAGSSNVGGLVQAISGLLNKMLGGIKIEYLGVSNITRADNSVPYHFRVNINMTNVHGWTLGWGNLDISVVDPKSGRSLVTVAQLGDFMIAPNESKIFTLNITMYDSNNLKSFIESILYSQTANITINGLLDVYFAGVWLRDINVSSQSLGGTEGTASPVSMDQLLGSSLDFGSMFDPEKIRGIKYDLSMSEDRLIIRLYVDFLYERMPVIIYSARGSIVFDGEYVGSINVGRIDLDKPTMTGYVENNVTIEISLKKDSSKLKEFIQAFVKNSWGEKTEFIGVADFRFLNDVYYNVPIQISGFGNSQSVSELPISSDLGGMYYVKNMSYLGEKKINGTAVFGLGVWVEIFNQFGVPIRFGPGEISVYDKDKTGLIAKIIVNDTVLLSPYSFVDAFVEVDLYNTTAMIGYLNNSLRGFNEPLSVTTNISVILGSIEVNLERFETTIATSLLDSISGSVSGSSSLYGSNVHIIDSKEYSDRIEVYVNATVDIPLPMRVDNLFATVSLYENSSDPPVTVEMLSPLVGPETSTATFRVVLYNSSVEFEQFVRGYVYGDINELYVDVTLDLELFGVKYSAITLSGLKIASEVGNQQSVVSAIKLDNMFRVVRFDYIGHDLVDGQEAYVFEAQVNITNNIGVSFEFWDTVLLVRKNNESIIKIRVDDDYSVSSHGSILVNVTIYIYKGKEALKSFIEEAINENLVNIELEGTVNLEVFGVELPDIEIVQRLLLNLTDQLSSQNYQDLGMAGGGNSSIKEISLIYDDGELSILHVKLDVDVSRYPIKIWSYNISVGLLGADKPALIVYSNTTVNLDTYNLKTLDLIVYVIKKDKQYIDEFLRRAIQNNLYPLDIEGTVEAEVFGVDVTLNIKLNNLSQMQTTSDVLNTVTFAQYFSLRDIGYYGEEYINGEKAYAFGANITFRNIYGVGVKVGPYSVHIIKNGEEVLRLEIPEVWVKPNNETTIPLSFWFFSKNETYDFLKELIEERKINATFNGYGNITIFGRDIINVNMTYPLLYEIGSAVVSAESVGGVDLPLGKLRINKLLFNVSYEDSGIAILDVNLNLTNEFNIPLTIWSFDAEIRSNNVTVFEGTLNGPINLKGGYIFFNMTLKLYKNDETARFIRELIMSEVSQAGATVQAKLLFLEWNFTINITINNFEYSGSPSDLGDVAGVPLDFSDLVVLNRVEQYGNSGLTLEVTINNIFNTTIGFGGVDFAIIYKGEEVVVGDIPETYTAGPNENLTAEIKILFVNSTRTEEFLRELLVNKTFNATVSFNLTILKLFGLNITNINIIQKVFIDFSKMLSSGAISNIGSAGNSQSQIAVKSIAITGSESRGSDLYINASILLSESFVDLSISNLNFTIKNEYGVVGYALINSAVLRYSEDSILNVTIVLPYQSPNNALEDFIRDVVEDKILDVNISGSLDLTLFGFYIPGISLETRLNMTLETSGNQLENATALASNIIPLEDILRIRGLAQKTFGSSPYLLEANISLASPVDTEIAISDLNITLYCMGDKVINLLSEGTIALKYEEFSNATFNIYIYDTYGTKQLIENMLNGSEVNVTIVGYVTIDILGAHIENLYLNYTINLGGSQESLSTSTSSDLGLSELSADFLKYEVEKIVIEGETESIANITIIVNTSDSKVYFKVYHLDLIIFNDYGDIARVIISEPAEFSPIRSNNVSLKVILFKGGLALQRLVEEYLRDSKVEIGARGNITVQLFSDSTQYLTINATIDVGNLEFGSGNGESSNSGSLIPIDLQSLVAYKSMHYVGHYWDENESCDYYSLEIEVDFHNVFNISLSIEDLAFTVYRDNITIIKGVINKLLLTKDQNQTIMVEIRLYDRPQTKYFLQDLINKYELSVEADIEVGKICFFGVEVTNVSLRQIFGWNVSQQLEGEEVQNSVLSIFDYTIGDIIIWGENDTMAKLGFEINISNAQIEAEVHNTNIDLIYDERRVANVYIPYLEVSSEGTTSQMINVTIFKQYPDALEGFLNDLLVKKNITVDIRANLTVRLFDSDYLWLDVSVKYNNTVYSVESYYQSMMTGEIDASSMLENIIKYSSENVTWQILEETDYYVKLRLSEELWSALSINIWRMETELYMEPFNVSTLFAVQTLVGSVSVPANGTGNITIEITFFKNRYLQEFLDSVLHNWSIDLWADTTIDLGLFGVNITDLRVTSARFSYLITNDVIQHALDNMVSEEVNSIDASAVAVRPIGYGTWKDLADKYLGVESADQHAEQIWDYDPSSINVWNYEWILIEYLQQVGSYGFNVSLSNFRAFLVYNGLLRDGSSRANGTLDDFFGVVYFDNLTLITTNESSQFHIYVWLWRTNPLSGSSDSMLDDWLWAMVKYNSYNFSIVNVTFDLDLWGCHIEDVEMERLNFTGVYDPSSLANVLEFKGLNSYSVGFNLNEYVYADVTFTITVPMSPEWLVYYAMMITWDDDPIFFQDTDIGDDPPATGTYNGDGTATKESECEEFTVLDPDAQPLAHSLSDYYIFPRMVNAPTSLPSYAVWFGYGGDYTLKARINIEWTDGHHDYLGNVDVDQKYDDELLTAQGKAEREDANGDAYNALNWEGTEDGDMWSMVMLGYRVEILMFWWVIYYFTPTIYIASGDYNPNIENENLVSLSSTTTWYFFIGGDLSSSPIKIMLYRLSNGTWVMYPYADYDKYYKLNIGGYDFMDSYDGSPDVSEPDFSGTYTRTYP